MTTAMLAPGVWGILATPFYGPDLDVDLASIGRQVDAYRSIGANGVVALGVFGEAAKLDATERRAVVQATVEAAEDLEVVVGLTSLAARPTLEQAREASAAAGDRLAGLMVQVNSSDPQALRAHLRAVREATGAGIVVQDYPRVSGVHITPSSLLAALEDSGFVVAIKAESPPTSVSVSELAAGTDVPVFGGLGGVGLIDELAAGAAGAMTGFSHPEGLVAAVEAYRDGGFEAAHQVFMRWLPIANFEAQEGIGLAIRKELLRRRGVLAEAGVRPPGKPMPESLHPLADAHLAALAG